MEDSLVGRYLLEGIIPSCQHTCMHDLSPCNIRCITIVQGGTFLNTVGFYFSPLTYRHSLCRLGYNILVFDIYTAVIM